MHANAEHWHDIQLLRGARLHSLPSRFPDLANQRHDQHQHRASDNPGDRIDQRRDDHRQPAHSTGCSFGHAFDPMMSKRQTVNQNPAADHEHGRSTDNRQYLHQYRRKPEQSTTDFLRRRACSLFQVQAQVVKLDDTCHQSIDTHGNQHSEITSTPT